MSKPKKVSAESKVVVVSSKRSLKSLLLIFAVVLLVVAAVIVARHYHFHIGSSKTKKPTVASTDCLGKASSPLLEQAVPLLNANKNVQLGQVVAKIKQVPTYSQDPNCLYVVVTYYIDTSDAVGARQNLTKLEKVYQPSQGFSGIFGPSTKSLATLQADVAYLEKFQQQMQTNYLKMKIPNQP